MLALGGSGIDKNLFGPVHERGFNTTDAFSEAGFNMSDQGKASVPKAVRMRRQKRDNAAENDIKNIYNIFIKSNCFPFQSLFFQQSSYLMYDVHAKTAPKSLLNKFAKKTSL